MSILCVLNIGHCKKKPGAKSPNGITEFQFNDDMAKRIKQKVRIAKIELVYQENLKNLPKKINALSPNFVISLHCNAFFLEASGTETLYHRYSDKSKQMAAILQRHIVYHLNLPNRGIKATTMQDRGGYLLYNVKAPAVICEPFFIDNSADFAQATNDLDGLADTYAYAIAEIALSI